MSDFAPSFREKLDRLQQTIENTEDELKRLRVVYSRFPNLEVRKDRWGQERYCSLDVNAQATDFNIALTCGTVIIRPLVVFNGFNIYSDPPEYQIANASEQHYGYDFYSNWEEILIVNNVSAVVIEKVKVFQQKHLPDQDSDDAHDYTCESISEGNEKVK